jgi:hypothetical protein
MTEVEGIALIALAFVVVGTIVASASARESHESLRPVWRDIGFVAVFVLMSAASVLAALFAVYTFIPLVVALPLLIWWNFKKRTRHSHEHVTEIPERYRRST